MVCIIHTDILCRNVQPRTHFVSDSEILLNIGQEKKRKKFFISEGMLESAQGSAWQGQSRRPEEVLVRPYHHGSAHEGKSEGWRTDWVYQHGGDQAHLCDVAPD